MKNLVRKILSFLVIILFFASTFFGCTSPQKMVRIPSFEKAWQLQRGTAPDPKDVSEALRIFYRYYHAYFGKIPLCIDSVMIDWRNEPTRGKGYSITGKMGVGTVKGMAISPGYIWVWKGEENKIYSTALVHELIHSAIWCNNEHGDPDHEGTRYQGWTSKHTEFLYRVNYLLREKNL